MTGKSSCMVALPKRWVREIGLKQGSEVTITKLNSAALLVRAPAGLAQTSGGEANLVMHVDDTLEAVLRKIVSLYVIGFRKISVIPKGASLGSAEKIALKDSVRRTLVGTEGIAEPGGGLTFQVLLGYSDLGVEGALKKMLSVFESLMKDATSSLGSGDLVTANTISQRQDEVRRFEFYVNRQLNRSLNQGAPPELRFENRDALGYTLIARNLERATHHVRALLDATRGLEGVLAEPVTKYLASLNQTASKLMEDALLSLFKRDHQGAGSVIEKSKKFVVKGAEVLHSVEVDDSQAYYMLHLLMDSQRSIAEYAGDIAEVVLDMTVERTLSWPDPNEIPVQYA